MNDLINEVQQLIDKYYKDRLEDTKFKSADDEESVDVMIDEFKEDLGDLIYDYIEQIEYEIKDCSIIELEKYRI